MGTIDLRKFDDVRHLVRARLLSSEFHDLEMIVKEHIAADVWKTYYECLAVSSDMDVHTLAHMVHDINRSEVAEQDRLSDHVFRLADNTLAVAV